MAGPEALLQALFGGFGAGNTFNPGLIAPLTILRMQTNPLFFQEALKDMMKDTAMRRVAKSKGKLAGPKRLVEAVSPELESLTGFTRDLELSPLKGETSKEFQTLLKDLNTLLSSTGRL